MRTCWPACLSAEELEAVQYDAAVVRGQGVKLRAEEAYALLWRRVGPQRPRLAALALAGRHDRRWRRCGRSIGGRDLRNHRLWLRRHYMNTASLNSHIEST